MRVEQSLPELKDTDYKRAQAMERHLCQIIEQNKSWLSFHDCMQILLYEPQLGYYTGQTEQFGRGGDFVTAPQISSLFSKALASQCQDILQQFKHQNAAVLEIGAGSGEMAAQIMSYLAEQGCLPSQYAIFDISPNLRDQQYRYLQATVPELMDYFVWYEVWPTEWHGVVLANEVLDAMPVRLWQWQSSALYEWGVTVNNDQLCWQKQPADNDLQQTVNTICQSPGVQAWPDNYVSEVHPHINPWINSISQMLQQGVVLLFDYGYPRREYYRPERHAGTLKCFYQHISHEDPLTHLGCQDITAHIDFTSVVEAAAAHDMELEGFCTQADFLLSCGIDQLTPKDYTMSDSPKVALAQQLKQLLMPDEMGEIIKVMGLSKGYQACLQGFMRRDLSRQL